MKKITHIITTVLFLAILFGLAAAFVIIPDKDYSENEKRNLQTFPEFSLEALMDGKFSSEINEYFADQFPLRDAFVSIKALAELSLFKGENNGVLLGENETLAVRTFSIFKDRLNRTDNMDHFYNQSVVRQLEALNKFAAEKASVPVHVIIPPRVIDVASESFNYPSNVSVSLDALVSTTLSEDLLIPVSPVLKEKYSAGEYVYYRTDHHWTTLGAYYAYVEIMKSFGMEDDIIPRDKFTVNVVADDFYGTTWSKCGFSFVSPDTMEFWSLGNEDKFTTTIGERSFSGFYDMSYLETMDKYSAFISGTNDVTLVESNNDEERPVLLLPKDSFANSLVPFLAQHFDLVLVNMANRMTNISAYTQQYSADRILFVWNAENLITSGNLGNVN
ncbi:MAG: hypothetical protein J6S77_06330 [Clostridia bacterium]|nr:hypothetical protein [Clostridia bacterium]MBO7738307.1 hypothetical protein [Clostridia bacterium]